MYKRKSRNKGATPTGFSTSTPADNGKPFSTPSQSPINDGVHNLQKKRNILQVDKPIVSANKHAKIVTGQKFNSYFDEMVIKAGMILQTDDNIPHLLTKDQALFIRDLDSALKKSASYPENVKEFLDGLEKHFVTNGQLLKLLKSVKTSADCEIARGQLQDSLIRQLLQIECLQSKIIEMLLEKLAEFVLNESDDQDSMSVPWVQMILHQMRLLDNIVDGRTLNDTLFAVLETAPISAQREIIYCLPDILADDEHHEAALKLSKLMKDKFELTSAVIEALDSLDLQPDLRAEVCQHMLITLRRAPPEFLPSIVGFLVSFQGSNDDLVELVAGLRKELDMTPAGGIDSSCQVLIMAALRSGALRCSGVVDVWLKAISATQSPSEIYPLDVVMMLVFHSTVQKRKKQVEAVLRGRIKNGILTEAVINKTFILLLAVIKEYLKSAVEVASLLLRSPESPVSYLGGRWFKLMLEHLDEIHSQSVVFDLLLLIGTGGVNITNASLQVMADTETKYLVPHAAVLLGLLEKLQDMALVQAGQVMDVLCRLVYSNERNSLHEDDIHILIRKYLSSSNNMLKEKGVVSAVMAVKNMASAETEDSEDVPSSVSSSESVLSVRGRRAKDLLEFVEESIQQNVLALGLFYDQMAAMICSSGMCDSTFLEWVGEKTAQNFQDFYIKDLTEKSKERSDSSTQFLLDTDLDGAICVDISGVMREEKLLGANGLENGHPVCLLAPLFLLLRTVKFRNDNGDLGSIDALLGCGVTMPNNLTDLVDDFTLLDSEKQIFLLDSLFYCINWFRELVNAFAYQKSTDLQRKVIIRLHDVVTLQQLLVKCLCHAKTMDYKPPRCHFHIEVKTPQQEKVKKPTVSRKGAKRGKGKKETAHTSVGDATEAAAEEVAPLGVSSKSEIDLTQYKGFFREMSMDVFVLLGNKLIIQPEGEEQEACMRPVDLLFLLEDYLAKLDHYLPSTTKRINLLRANQQPSSIGFSNLMMNHIAPQVFARNTIKLLPHIVKMLKTAGDYCQNLLEQNNGVYDGPTMFKEDTTDIKLCYSLLIGAVAVTLGWSGLRSSTNLEMLRDGLWALASRVMKKEERSASVKVLVLKSCEYLITYSSRTLYLPAAWNLVRAIQVLCSHAPSEGQPREQLAAVCRDFLSRKWYTLKGVPEQGSAYNQHISSLLETYLGIMSDDLSQIRNIVMWVKDEAAALEHKESSLKTFPSITRLNFFILYQNLWKILVKASEKALHSTFGCDDKLKVWHCTANIMENLITIIKQHDHRCNQLAVLKHSQFIMKTFLSEGVPVLETLLKSNPENVNNMLKTLQTTLRYLHLLCVTTKAEKMSSLLNHLPVIRRTQEALLYRIKGMLAANNCSDAFWMGNLKNKTLKGEEVLTQDSTENDGEEEEGEQDEVVEEDENSDVDMNSRSDEDDNGSVSDTY